MSTLLSINSSLFGANGQSSQLAQQYIEQTLAAHPATCVVNRDLSSEPVPHLTAEAFQGFMLEPSERNQSQQASAELSDQLIEELKSADTLVLGLPMYNFGVPSTLKAYFDYIARAGITFQYTANGPVGLLEGKKAIVLAARGGLYQGTPRDTQTSYVKDFLAFLGIDDIQFIYAEGLAMGDEAKGVALHEASDAIKEQVA